MSLVSGSGCCLVVNSLNRLSVWVMSLMFMMSV